jgi:hypothetical protein
LVRASLAFDGRSIRLQQEVHSIKTKERKPKKENQRKKPKENRVIHSRFFRRLKALMGDKVTLTIVTYAAFKAPWFRQVSKLEWDFVERTRRPNTFSSDEKSSWDNICNLFGQATTASKVFHWHITKNNPLVCR